MSTRSHPFFRAFNFRGTRFATALIVVVTLAASGVAQSTQRPYSLADVLTLLQAAVPTTKILPRVLTKCISFRLTQDNLGILQSNGADRPFLNALKSVCYKGASDDRSPVPPAPVIKTVVKHDTVAVRVGTEADSIRRWQVGRILYDYDLQTYRGLPIFSTETAESGYGTTRYTSKGYELTYPRVNQAGAIRVGPSVGSARIDATLISETVQGNQVVGIIFDSDSSAKTYYRFAFDGWGHFWVSGEGRAREVLPISYTSSNFINTSAGGTNNLTIEIRGAFGAFYINGNFVAGHTFPTRLVGYTGLYVSGAKISVPSMRAVELK